MKISYISVTTYYYQDTYIILFLYVGASVTFDMYYVIIFPCERDMRDVRLECNNMLMLFTCI